MKINFKKTPSKTEIDGLSLVEEHPVEVAFECHYSSKVELSSESYSVTPLNVLGSVVGQGSLADGFELVTRGLQLGGQKLRFKLIFKHNNILL